MRPDIKTYRENLRSHYISPLKDRPHFTGRDALDVRWGRKMPATNLKKEGSLLELEISIPGFKKDEIQILVDDDILTVRAERQKEENELDSRFIIREFDVDIMERKFQLSDGVGHEKISARYVNGILSLTFTDVPSELEQNKQKVEVK